GGGGGSLDGNTLEQTLSHDLSLKDHLLAQLALEIDDPVMRMIGAHVIESIDEAGYVSEDLEAIADRLGCTFSQVEACLLRMQSFEPTGVLARTLSECLALQLKERDRLDPAMERMLENLDLVARLDI